jgi:hypothetical protein
MTLDNTNLRCKRYRDHYGWTYEWRGAGRLAMWGAALIAAASLPSLWRRSKPLAVVTGLIGTGLGYAGLVWGHYYRLFVSSVELDMSDPKEAGVQQGRLLSFEIAQSCCFTRMITPEVADTELDGIYNALPEDLQQEIQGIVEGVNQKCWTLLQISTRDVIAMHLLTDPVWNLRMNPVLVETNVIAVKKNGAVALGYSSNVDCFPVQLHRCRVTRRYPDGTVVQGQAAAGMVGVWAGANDQSALAMSNDRRYSGLRKVSGIPSPILNLQALRTTSSLDEITRFFQTCTPSFNYRVTVYDRPSRMVQQIRVSKGAPGDVTRINDPGELVDFGDDDHQLAHWRALDHSLLSAVDTIKAGFKLPCIDTPHTFFCGWDRDATSA